MKQIADIIESGEYKSIGENQRLFRSNCSPEEYRTLFLAAAKDLLYYSGNFIVDNRNKSIINQLYFYLAGCDQFEGDLLKGILLIGPIGTGKTVIMDSFIEVFNATSNKIITCIHAKDISRITKENPVGHLNRRPLFLDDIAKEQVEIKNFGTPEHPFEDLISERYKRKTITLATSNFKLEDMPYAQHTTDRMRQMFNVLVLNGESRRS